MAKKNSKAIQECTRLAYLYENGDLTRFDLIIISRELRNLIDSEDSGDEK